MSYRVLVTGASGFIGDALTRMLGGVAPKIDFTVIPAVREAKGLPGEVVLDFDTFDFISKIREIQPVDAIVHLGAVVDFKVCIDKLAIPNILSTAILANWAREIGAHFIFASTATVYGVGTPRITEDTEINTDTDYALSKIMAEMVIKKSGVDYLILRLAGVFGNNGSRSLGVNRSVYLAQRGEIPTLFGNGAGKRNYIYVVDLVKLLVFCLKSRTTGTHLVAGTEEISIADMLQGVCDTFLPGTNPEIMDGESGRNQIVEPSQEMRWSTRKFGQALQHMRLWSEKEGD